MFPTDQSLFSLIADQNEVAFTRIYRKYYSVVFSRIRRFIHHEEDATDLTQKVFLNLWVHGAPLKEVVTPAAWLNRAASNASINYVRRQYVRRNMMAAAGYHGISIIPGDQDLSYQQLSKLVLEALARLPVPDSAILRLHLDSGYGPKRLATELELPEGSVRKRLETSRTFLRQYVRDRIEVWLPVLCFIF